MPGVIQSDSVYETATLLHELDDEESDDSDTETKKRKRRKQPQKPARKPKKACVTAATAMIDLTEKLCTIMHRRTHVENGNGAKKAGQRIKAKGSRVLLAYGRNYEKVEQYI